MHFIPSHHPQVTGMQRTFYCGRSPSAYYKHLHIWLANAIYLYQSLSIASYLDICTYIYIYIQIYMCLCIDLSLSILICISVCLSMSINVHLCLSTCLSICLCVFYASMFFMYGFIYLSIYLSTYQPTYLSIYNSIYKSIYVSIYLSTSTLPAKLFIWLLEKKKNYGTQWRKKKEHKPFSCQGKKQRRITDAAYINVCLSIYLFI